MFYEVSVDFTQAIFKHLCTVNCR